MFSFYMNSEASLLMQKLQVIMLNSGNTRQLVYERYIHIAALPRDLLKLPGYK